MAGSKASRVSNVWDRLRDNSDKILRDDAVSRRRFNPLNISIPPNPETPPAGNSGSDSGNALLTAGDTMIGAIAFFPILLLIQDLPIGKPASATSRVLDISAAIGAQSSRIIANGGVGTTDLEFIKGAGHAGQWLNLQGTATQTITIKDDASGNGSEGFNIRTQTGGDLVLVGNANILLVFDSTQNQWVVISAVSGSAAVLSLGQLTDVAITPDPPIANDILQFNTTSGLWENQPGSAAGGLLPDLSNLQAGAVPVVDMSLNNQDLENVSEIRMNAAGIGLIDNVQTLDFFQNLHSIQSIAEGFDFTVESVDRMQFVFGVTSSVTFQSHGIDADDIRFTTAEAIAANAYQITRNSANLMNFNVPDTRAFDWSENGTSQMTLNNGTLTTSIFNASNFLFVQSQPFFTSVDGSIANVNNDVIIGSGGNSVNITNLFDNINLGQFADDTFTIFNVADPSKVATFSAASLSQTRIFTFQDTNGRLALLDGVQQDFTVNVGFTNNNLLDVGGIFTTSAPTDIGQKSNYFTDLYINQIFWFGDTSTPPAFKIGGNTANGFDFVVSDTNKEFDFFFDGTGTTPSWIIRNSAIDAQGNKIEDLEEIQFRGNNVIPTPSSVLRFGFTSSRGQINMPTGGGFDIMFNGTAEWFFSASSLTGDNVIINDTLTFVNDQAFIDVGQIVRSGSDLFVSTTNGVKNMKDIGSGGGGASDRIESPNSQTSVIATDSSVTTRVSSGDRLVVQAGGVFLTVPLNMSGRELDLGTGPITNSGNITFANAFSVLNMFGSNVTDAGQFACRSGSGVGLNLRGKNITNCEDIEIEGEFEHKGSLVGFFGATPVIKKRVDFQGTSLQDVGLTLAFLLQALSDTFQGLGLIDSNV